LGVFDDCLALVSGVIPVRKLFPSNRRLWLALPVPLLLASPLPAPFGTGQGVAAQERFSLDQILSAPFPSGLVAAPSGGSVAWIQNAEGRRNVWLAAPPDFQGRQVTAYAEDDGQEITDLQFTPDGARLVFVRGGAPNRAGDLPNPALDPQGVDRGLWILGTDGGEPAKLAEGSSPAVSPRGDRAAFLKDGQIHTALLDGSAEAERLFHVRRGAGPPSWSPDGSRIAFVASRGNHSFVGVYDLESRKLLYLDPSVDRDGSPAWAPDSRRVAFIRQPNVRDELPFFPRRRGHPWSIRVADVESGRGREVWRAREGVGSVYRSISAQHQVMWSEGDRLVFPWEGDGWTHLYSVSPGEEAILLTPGEFEVQFASLSPDGREVLFSSNQDDVDRQHLWRVPVSGGRPQPVTGGMGVEWSPVMTSDGGVLAYLGSAPRLPAHAWIQVGTAASRRLAPMALPDDFPIGELVDPEPVVFSAADGLQIHGQLFLPRDLRPGERLPALLFFHGGSRRQMLLSWHHRGYYHNAYAMNQYLASQGYVVLSVNYRSGIGYGMEFREALDYGASGGSELNDVVGAGLYLQSRPDVDPERIGLWGGSYGGYLTALGLARASDLFAAGVDFHGVHDWNTGIRNFVPSYEPTHHPEIARVAFEASPMAWVEDWRSPVLFIHGDDDRNVNIAETVELVELLRNQGVEFEQLMFPDEVHGFLLHRNWLAAYRATVDFFDRKLRGNR
jgi:dipeptidyl aminopeptidase/acylaminoacyl peptidase